MVCGRSELEPKIATAPFQSASAPEWSEARRLRNAEPRFVIQHHICGNSPQYTPNFTLTGGLPASKHAMLRQILLNSTDTHDFDLVMAQSTHSPASLNSSHGSVSVAALLRPTGRGGLREGELNKPDLTTYIVICLVLFLVVLLIVFFINCQLRNSFFASMPYDRSLREARSSYK